MDFLTSEEKSISNDLLKRLSVLSYQQRQLEDDADANQVNDLYETIKDKPLSLKTLEKLVKVFEEKLRQIKQVQIPTILNECGLKEITLKTGEKLTVEDKVKASIAKERMTKVIEEMTENEMRYKNISKEEAKRNVLDLFKEEIIIEKKDSVINMLLQNGVIYDTNSSIHYKTLEKYCKTLLDEGRNIPDGITVYTYQETKIKG